MKVMVFGTFDVLHLGHINFFQQAKEKAEKFAKKKFLSQKQPKRQGSKILALKRKKKKEDFSPKLVVVVARDINVKKEKGHWPEFSEKRRVENLKKLKIVDKVILGDKEDYFKVIKKEKPEVIALGYDQKVKIRALKRKLKKIGLEKTAIFRLKAYRPQRYKSSKLKVKFSRKEILNLEKKILRTF